MDTVRPPMIKATYSINISI